METPSDRDESRGWIIRPAWARALVLLAIWVGTIASSFAVGERFAWETNSEPFHLSLFQYNQKGRVQPAGESFRQNVRSLYYGERLTNLVITTELPKPFGETSTNPTGTGTGMESGATNLAPSCPPQPQYDIRNWTTLQGLPANKINAVLQTRDGYLWVGTVDGLVRFDSVRFTVFNDQNTPEFAAIGFNVRALFEDGRRPALDRHAQWNSLPRAWPFCFLSRSGGNQRQASLVHRAPIRRRLLVRCQ